MAAIIERVPWLDDRVSIKRFTKELEDVGGTESIYAALSRESGTKMGIPSLSTTNSGRARAATYSTPSIRRWVNVPSR